MPVYIEENNVDVNRPTDRANIEQSDFLKVKESKKSRYLQLSCELLMTQVVNIVCSYVLPYHPFQLYKSPHPWQPQKSRRPPILTPKQPKVAIFDKTDFWGLKYLGVEQNQKQRLPVDSLIDLVPSLRHSSE